jgi:hypothetical protein
MAKSMNGKRPAVLPAAGDGLRWRDCTAPPLRPLPHIAMQLVDGRTVFGRYSQVSQTFQAWTRDGYAVVWPVQYCDLASVIE